jgi:pimeloyl-ACP methyl ester carboxylesterase
MTAYQMLRLPRREMLRLRELNIQLTRWGPAPSAADPAVLLLHGWMDTADTFQFMIDAFERDRPLVALDWRGFGHSDWAREGYWFPDYFADLEALLDVLSPTAPMRLIGHSMGGNIASVYAGLRPERVRSLVNLEGLGLPATTPEDSPMRLRSWLDQIKSPPPPKYYESVLQLASVIQFRYPRFSAATAAFMAAAWSEPAGNRVKLRGDPRHRWSSPLRYQREDAVACWRQIRAPMLMLVGEDSAGGDFWRTVVPHIDLECILDAGHTLHIEQPLDVARRVERFLDAQQDQDAGR